MFAFLCFLHSLSLSLSLTTSADSKPFQQKKAQKLLQGECSVVVSE